MESCADGSPRAGGSLSSGSTAAASSRARSRACSKDWSASRSPRARWRRFHMSERRQVEAAYERRSVPADRYSLLSPPNLYMTHQRERELIRQLQRRGINEERLVRCRVLEVGSGSGGNLRRMIDYGVPAENLFGFDL